MGQRGPKPSFNDVACTNEECDFFRIPGLGNIVGNGTYRTRNGPIRKYICRSCGKGFCDRTDTFFYGLRTDKRKVIFALKMVITGMSLRTIGRIIDVKLDTLRDWLTRASMHKDEINKALLKETALTREELDGLWSSVGKKRFREWKSLRKKELGPSH